MNLNDQRRINLEQSGPWIGTGGLIIMLWLAIATTLFAPWWGVVLQVLLLVPAAILVGKSARTNPGASAFVPLVSFGVWLLVCIMGALWWGWGTR